jgi:hypothetical protein
MQATTQSTPEAPLAPAAPRPTSITTVGADGKAQTISIPKTQADVDALIRQRDEISNQLTNVNERRQELVQEIRSSPDGVARTGLEDRVKILDQRLIQLESDLAVTGRQLAGAPADLVQFAERGHFPPPNPEGDDWEEGLAVGVFVSLMTVGAVYAFRRWRRRKQPKARANELPSDSAQRLERLEQGMEAIAIEIERVSEGQRFVTKLLSESPQPVGINARIGQHEAEATRANG